VVGNSLRSIEGHLLEHLVIGYKDVRFKEAGPLQLASSTNYTYGSMEKVSSVIACLRTDLYYRHSLPCKGIGNGSVIK